MKLAKKSPKSQTVTPQLLPDKTSALILVHLQNDFFPGGALPVEDGDQILPRINQYITFFQHHGAAIMATRDWHPPNHCSFQEHGGPWPPHCIQGSRGAQFHANLHLPTGSLIISGATNPKKEIYSGFDGTSLADYLEDQNAKTIYLVGLATDYWVKQTVLDGIKLSLRVVVLEDGIRGVNVRPDDSEQALQEMASAGAIRATALDIGMKLTPQ
ncbi:nicotinamidase [Candidatus Nitrospira salsa]|nr:MAG: bifunctional pyrazinamidase/nicotinamidase [Nitrospirales bacterium]